MAEPLPLAWNPELLDLEPCLGPGIQAVSGCRCLAARAWEREGSPWENAF